MRINHPRGSPEFMIISSSPSPSPAYNRGISCIGNSPSVQGFHGSIGFRLISGFRGPLTRLILPSVVCKAPHTLAFWRSLGLLRYVHTYKQEAALAGTEAGKSIVTLRPFGTNILRVWRRGVFGKIIRSFFPSFVLATD